MNELNHRIWTPFPRTPMCFMISEARMRSIMVPSRELSPVPRKNWKKIRRKRKAKNHHLLQPRPREPRCGRESLRAGLRRSQLKGRLHCLAHGRDQKAGGRRDLRFRGKKPAQEIPQEHFQQIRESHQSVRTGEGRRPHCGLHLRRQRFHADGKAVSGVKEAQQIPV